MTNETRNQGEGNREAARRYAEKTQDFVDSGKVEEAARNAANMSDQERKEAEQAEETGKSHAKEFDRDELNRDYGKPGK